MRTAAVRAPDGCLTKPDRAAVGSLAARCCAELHAWAKDVAGGFQRPPLLAHAARWCWDACQGLLGESDLLSRLVPGITMAGQKHASGASGVFGTHHTYQMSAFQKGVQRRRRRRCGSEVGLVLSRSRIQPISSTIENLKLGSPRDPVAGRLSISSLWYGSWAEYLSRTRLARVKLTASGRPFTPTSRGDRTPQQLRFNRLATDLRPVSRVPAVL